MLNKSGIHVDKCIKHINANGVSICFCCSLFCFWRFKVPVRRTLLLLTGCQPTKCSCCNFHCLLTKKKSNTFYSIYRHAWKPSDLCSDLWWNSFKSIAPAIPEYKEKCFTTFNAYQTDLLQREEEVFGTCQKGAAVVGEPAGFSSQFSFVGREGLELEIVTKSWHFVVFLLQLWVWTRLYHATWVEK